MRVPSKEIVNKFKDKLSERFLEETRELGNYINFRALMVIDQSTR